MKISHTLTMLGFALALGSGLAAQDAPPPKPALDSTQVAMGPMAERLKLTEAQKTSLKEITAKHQAALATKGGAAKAARRAFFEAAQKPETSVDALRSLHRAMSDQDLEFLLERRAIRQEIRAELTPEQRELAARMEGRKEGMRMARGGVGGMMRGGRHGSDGPPAPVPASPSAQ